MARDLLKIIEEIKIERKLKLNINSTFIALIPKSDFPSSFDDFRPIALCRCLYKIHSKIIAMRLKPLSFLKGRLIHEAISAAQEGIPTIKTQKQK